MSAIRFMCHFHYDVMSIQKRPVKRFNEKEFFGSASP